MIKLSDDQEVLYESLKNLKKRFQNTQVLYNSEQLSLWKLADDYYEIQE